MKSTLIVLVAFGLLVVGPAAVQSGGPPEPKESPNPKQAWADAQTVAKGNTAFALDLYGRLGQKPGNLFFSPYSISTALAMVYGGARGQTAEQMQDVLHLGLVPERLHPACGALVERINAPPEKDAYKLSVGNALWGQQGYPFVPAYLDLTRRHYGAGFRQIDFRTDPDGARKIINTWVEKQTQKKITDLFKPGVINGMTRLVLANAIYFKGNWAEQFKKADTRDAPFLVAPDKKVQAPLMFRKKRFGHMKGKGFQALRMPYEGKNLSMVVLLPDKVDGLPALEKKLSAESLRQWLRQMRWREVRVFLPRFKMTSEFSLSGTLAAMGMPDAFIDGKADLSGINGSRDLFIQAVVHKAFIDVNEEGTEAAAATGITVGATSVPPPPTVFRADHPFLFMIVDQRTGSLLFMGRVVDPTKKT